jgi:hypothetical protein
MGRVDYIVRSSAQVANAKLAIWVLLTDGKTGAVLWSNRYETPLETAGIFDLQRNIAVRIASDIGRPRGIVASPEKTRIANDSFHSPQGFNCYLRALQFFGTFERADDRLFPLPLSCCWGAKNLPIWFEAAWPGLRLQSSPRPYFAPMARAAASSGTKIRVIQYAPRRAPR